MMAAVGDRLPVATPTLGPSVRDDLAVGLEALEYSKPGLDVETALASAIGFERAAEALGDDPLQQRARLVQADMYERLGQIPTAYRMLMEVNRWADGNVCRPVQARSHLLLSRVNH